MNKEDILKNLADLEKQVGHRSYESFPKKCWGVVEEIFGQTDFTPEEVVDVPLKVLPLQAADIVYMASGSHCGVVANSGRHLLQALPSSGLVCGPLSIIRPTCAWRHISCST